MRDHQVPKQPGCIYPGACVGNTYGHGVPQQEIYSALGFIHGRRQQLPDPELPSPQWVISALQHSPPLTRHSPAQTCTTPLHRPAVQAGDHHQTQAPGKTSGRKPPPINAHQPTVYQAATHLTPTGELGTTATGQWLPDQPTTGSHWPPAGQCCATALVNPCASPPQTLSLPCPISPLNP